MLSNIMMGVLSILAVGSNIYFLFGQLGAVSSNNILANIITCIIYLLLSGWVIYSLKKYNKFDIERYRVNSPGATDTKPSVDPSYLRNQLQNYYEEKLNSIQNLNNFSKIAIVVGFLGTLVGLVDALSILKSLDKSDSIAQVKGLTDTLPGLFVAFNTSIGGILTSIALTYIYSLLSKQINNYFLEEEKIIIAEEKRYLSDKVEESTDRWTKWEKKFELGGSDVNSIKSDILNLTNPLTNAVSNLSQKIVSTLDERFKQSIQDFKKVVDSMPGKIEDELTKMFGKVEFKYLDVLKKLEDQTSETKKEIDSQIKTLREINADYEKSLKKGVESRVDELKDALNKSLEGTSNKYEKELENIQTSINGFVSKVDDLKTIVNQFPQYVQGEINKFNTQITEREEELLEQLKNTLITVAKENLVKPTQEEISNLIQSYKDKIMDTTNPMTSLADKITQLSGNLEEKSKSLPSTIDRLGKSLNEWKESLTLYNSSIANTNNSINTSSDKLTDIETRLKGISGYIDKLASYMISITDSINKLAQYVELKGKDETKDS